MRAGRSFVHFTDRFFAAVAKLALLTLTCGHQPHQKINGEAHGQNAESKEAVAFVA
jgi:hypothetical protein